MLCIPLIQPPGSAPGHKLQKSSKESGIFQTPGAINFVLFYKKAESKGGQCTMLPPLNTLLLATPKRARITYSSLSRDRRINMQLNTVKKMPS